VAVEIGVRYGVRGLPNITVLSKCEVAEARIGDQSRTQLESLLKSLV